MYQVTELLKINTRATAERVGILTKDVAATVSMIVQNTIADIAPTRARYGMVSIYTLGRMHLVAAGGTIEDILESNIISQIYK